jgi:hypothetical protein
LLSLLLLLLLLLPAAAGCLYQPARRFDCLRVLSAPPPTAARVGELGPAHRGLFGGSQADRS